MQSVDWVFADSLRRGFFNVARWFFGRFKSEIIFFCLIANCLYNSRTESVTL
jgi:hypothetical protein